MRRTVVGIWEDAGFEVLVCYLGITGGILLLFGPTVPNSVEQSLPHIVVVIWAVELIVGCGGAIVGLLYRKFSVRKSIIIEAFSLALLSPMSFIYLIVLIGTVGLKGVFVGVNYLFFSLICLGRLRRLYKISREYARPGTILDTSQPE